MSAAYHDSQTTEDTYSPVYSYVRCDQYNNPDVVYEEIVIKKEDKGKKAGVSYNRFIHSRINKRK